MFIILSCLILCVIAYVFVKNEFERKKYPAGPYPWPIIGNIFHLDVNAPEVTINKWKVKYGKVFTVWLPSPIVVLADGLLMEETFGKPGETFAGRCHSAIMDILFKGNYGLMLNENHVYKVQRRFALQQLKQIGFGKAELEPLILMHLEDSINMELKRQENSGRVNTKRIFAFVNAAVMHRLVFGNVLNNVDGVMKFKLAGEAVFTDWYKPSWMLLEATPWLVYLEKFKLYDFGVQRAADNNNLFISFLESNIQMHFDRKESDFFPNYTDCFLEKLDKTPGFEYWQLVIACYDLWAAGVETITTTLQYAVLYLLHHPGIQTKLKKELSEFKEQMSAASLSKLVYLNAFIQEVHRLANVIPLSLVHETLEPCEIEGFKFETGTAIVAQLACVNLDPHIFPNPEACMPERHIVDGEFRPNKLLKPFSIGRRSCLGEALAKPQVLLILASMLKKYKIMARDEHDLPRIFARPGLVRVPDDFDCVFELE